jgi:hypothetical protein
MDQRSMVASRIDSFYHFAVRCSATHFYVVRFFRVRRFAFRRTLVGMRPPNDGV